MVYETGNEVVDHALSSALAGTAIDRESALALLDQPVEQVLAAAETVVTQVGDATVDACSIINAKSGGCPEDCHFCAQSAHYNTGIDTHQFQDPETILTAAKRAQQDGAQRFGIVIAGRGISREQRPAEWNRLIRAIRRIRQETALAVDASLGTLTETEAHQLAEEGIAHYNHNIETSQRFFPHIVSTHSFTDRVTTLRRAKAAGMDLCAGVILGLGERPADRVDAALTLRDIGVDSIPINVLNPVAGTPLETQTSTQLAMPELLRTIAIYRLLHPQTRIRLAGGREHAADPDEQHRLLEAGANGLLIGDYLTTTGQDPDTDRNIIERAGREFNTAETDVAVDTADTSPSASK